MMGLGMSDLYRSVLIREQVFATFFLPDLRVLIIEKESFYF